MKELKEQVERVEKVYKKRGRKKLSKCRDRVLCVKLYDWEYKELEVMALKSDISMAEYIRLSIFKK